VGTKEIRKQRGVLKTYQNVETQRVLNKIRDQTWGEGGGGQTVSRERLERSGVRERRVKEALGQGGGVDVNLGKEGKERDSDCSNKTAKVRGGTA